MPDPIEKLRNFLKKSGEADLSAKQVVNLQKLLESLDEYLRHQESESRRLLDQLARAASLAELGAMTAAVIHETSQPLLGIKSYAELILEESQKPELAKLSDWAQEILKQVARIQEYQEGTRNFLQRPEVGEPAELARSVDDALLLFRQRMRKREVRGAINLPSGLPRLDISPQHLSQILINLIDNSLDAMQTQPATLRIAAKVDRDDQTVRVVIADTGPGISDQASSTLFEPFYSTKGKDGTGLGLYVSRALAEANRGKLELIDPAGLGWKETPGTAFELCLPWAGEPEPAGPAGEEPRGESRTGHQSLSLRMKNYVRHLPANQTALVVDDEPVIRKVLVDYLARQQIPGDQATSAEQALEQLPGKQYAVALIDKNLPGVDGIELLQTVKRKWPLTEVIIITGYESKESALEAIRAGAFDYIPKPFPSLSYIINKVQGAIARHNFEARLQSVIQFLSNAGNEGGQDQAEQARRLSDLMTSYQAPEGLDRVLVVGSQSRARAVEEAGYQLLYAENLRAAVALARQEKAQSVVFAERKEDGISGARAVEVFRQLDPHIGVFVLSQVGQLRRIVDAIGAGAGDYMIYPMEGEELFEERLKRLVARQERLARYRALIAALQELNVDILAPAAKEESPRDRREIEPNA